MASTLVMPSLALPIEILEQLLDHYGDMLVYNHNPTLPDNRLQYYEILKSRALTCKALLPRSRYNLYRSVILENRHKHFIETLKGSPHLARYIRVLHIVSYKLSKPPSIFFCLAGRLPHIHALEIAVAEDIFLHKHLHMALSSFSTITMLTLCIRIGVPEIQRLLHTLYNLRYLELLVPPIVPADSSAYQKTCHAPRCRLTSFVTTLRMVTQPAIPDIGIHRRIMDPHPGWLPLYYSFLQTPELFSSLKRFYIEIMSWAGETERNAEVSSLLFSAAHSSLEEAFIYFHEPENTGLTRLVSLHDNTNLRRLGLFLDNAFDEEVVGLVPLLLTISSSILREIVLFGWDGFKRVQSSTWALLDEALCDSRFDALTSIQVIEDVEDQNPLPAVERLPRCASRGLISSSYISSAVGSFNHKWITWAPEYQRMLFEDR
ncbi:unnamed protein product [Somion occarium]|uniref:Maturase n=1 Tax=Somion occarium TaxID=3059160 RepID=A0ABP1CSS1_9APHY